MTCSFCSLQFEASGAASACGQCGSSGGCRSVCCPRCGYHMPDEPGFVRAIRRWLGREEIAPAVGVAPLGALAPGQRGTVEKLDTADVATARKLLALGLLPGTDVELERARPGLVLRIGFSRLALDEQLARTVIVKVAA